MIALAWHGPVEATTVVPNRADRRRHHTRTATRADQQTSPKALHVAPLTIRPRSSNPAARKLAKRLIRRALRIQAEQENTA